MKLRLVGYVIDNLVYHFQYKFRNTIEVNRKIRIETFEKKYLQI